MFYSSVEQVLRTQLEGCYTHKFGPGKLPKVNENGARKIVGLICPHAGYMYSGPVAAHAYYKLAEDGKPDVAVILGPNHTGRGSALAIVNEGSWQTPLGDVEVEGEIANKILREAKIIDVDESAHVLEHSIEVQLPFLQYLYGKNLKFVPICFLMQDLETSRGVGEAIAKVLTGRNAIVIASTDMTHYEPQSSAERKDRSALNALLELNEEKFYSTVERQGISMCGYGPAVSLTVAVKALLAKEVDLLCYKTSGAVTGDFTSVVGYASISFTK
jgi:hypothetical protein